MFHQSVKLKLNPTNLQKRNWFFNHHLFFQRYYKKSSAPEDVHFFPPLSFPNGPLSASLSCQQISLNKYNMQFAYGCTQSHKDSTIINYDSRVVSSDEKLKIAL